MALADIPGLGAYIQRSKMNDEAPLAELQQVSGLMGLITALQKQKQDQELSGVLSQYGEDPAKAIPALLKSGNVNAAGSLAQLLERMDKSRRGQSIGSGGLRLDDGTVIPPAARPGETKTKLEKYIELHDSMPDNDPRKKILGNAIRKESETAKQISPTINIPRQVQPLVPIVGPDGKPVLVTREQAVGKTPAGAGSKAEAVEAGKTDVDKDIVTLKSAIDALNEGGGITSTEKGVLPNIGRWASNTGVGQTLGSMGGTHNQKARDVIAQARPLLLRSIMQATGMSARSLDSNAELKLWLSTATDPTKGYEANIEALNNIASKYGSGGFMEDGQNTKGTIRPSRRAADWKDL